MDIVEKAYNELLKNLQKARIMSVAMKKSSKSLKNQKKVKADGKTELSTAKNTLSKTSEGLKDSVKGKFGKKLTQVLEKQNTLMEDF